MRGAPGVAAYRRLLVERFPSVRVRRCEALLSGWDNVLLRVNGTWMFRVPRRPENEVALRREAALLPELAPTLPVAVPRFEYLWEGEAPPRIVVGYRRIPGTGLTAAGLAGPRGAAAIRPLAGFLRALHAFPLDRAARLGFDVIDPKGWRSEYEATFRWIRTEAFPRLTARERDWTTRRFEGYLDEPRNFRFAPALLHRDLEAQHVLVLRASGRVTGVIDWGDASVGDPAFDFAGLLRDLGAGPTRRILRAYGGPRDAGALARAGFYADLHPFYAIIYGRQLDRPDWVREGREELRTLAG